MAIAYCYGYGYWILYCKLPWPWLLQIAMAFAMAIASCYVIFPETMCHMLACILSSFWSFWGALGIILGTLGGPWASFWGPWASLLAPWAPHGEQVNPGSRKIPPLGIIFGALGTIFFHRAHPSVKIAVFFALWLEVWFLIDFGSALGGPGASKTMVLHWRGCNFHIFTDLGFWSLSGSILGQFWVPKWTQNH